MANTTYTIIKPSVLNSTTVIDNLKEFVRYIWVEEDGIRAISRGSYINDLLERLSLEYDEVFIAEHTSSSDMYNSRILVKYENGISVIINDVEDYIIYYYKKDKNLIKQEVIDRIHQLVKENKKVQVSYHIFKLDRYKYMVVKNRNNIEVSVFTINETKRCSYNRSSMPREVNKLLIPQLIAEAEVQAQQLQKFKWW